MKKLATLTDMMILGRPGLSCKPPRIAARGIVKNSDGLYAVIYQRKYGLYSLPGGGVEKGEDTVGALKREMLEEIGCTCTNITEIGIVEENRFCHDFTQINNYYFAYADIISEPNLTEKEIASETVVEWHTLYTVLSLISPKNNIETEQRKYISARDTIALQAYIKKKK